MARTPKVRTPVIQEGGNGRAMHGVYKLRTGNVDWVPEEEVRVKELYVVENGEYFAEDESAYAYFRVCVNIPGGAPDMPALPPLPDLPTPVDPRSPIIPTPPVIPTNPDPAEYPWDMNPIPAAPFGMSVTGYEGGQLTTYQVDKYGNLYKDLVPYGIRVVKPPDKVEYKKGEKIDYSGIRVALRSQWGEDVSTNRYPDGMLPFNELSFPVTELPYDTSDRVVRRAEFYNASHSYVGSETCIVYKEAHASWTIETHDGPVTVKDRFITLGEGDFLICFGGTYDGWTLKNMDFMIVSSTGGTREIPVYEISLEVKSEEWPPDGFGFKELNQRRYVNFFEGHIKEVSWKTSDTISVELNRQFEYDGKKVYYNLFKLNYYAHYYPGSLRTTPIPSSDTLGKRGWAALYGETLEDGKSVPVQWRSYYDGETLTANVSLYATNGSFSPGGSSFNPSSGGSITSGGGSTPEGEGGIGGGGGGGGF